MADKKEYIERGALIRLFDERYITAIVQQKHDDVPEDHKKHWKGVQSGTNWCKNTVLEATASDVVEVVHGEWILWKPRRENRNATYKCSVCGKLRSSYYNDVGEWEYCPCGARMDGERKDKL